MAPQERVFCLHCGDFMPYDVGLGESSDTLMDGPVPFTELVARCSSCGHEVYVPMVHDQNVMARLAALDRARLEMRHGKG